MKKNNRKITSIFLTLILIITTILCVPITANASSPDDLIGTWQRFSSDPSNPDGGAGTIVKVTKAGNGYQAVLTKVTGTLVDLGFAVGDVKWKDVIWKSGTSYSGTDLFRYEDSSYGNEYWISSLNIDNSGILHIIVAKSKADVDQKIGANQAWKKVRQIVLQIGNPKMTVNGIQKEIDPGKGTVPLIDKKSSRTILPIRAIIEELGGTIAWDATDRKVTIQLGTKKIELWIGSTSTRINGSTVMADVAPQIIKSRTMLPLRYIIDNLGYSVDWDGTTSKVTITY